MNSSKPINVSMEDAILNFQIAGIALQNNQQPLLKTQSDNYRSFSENRHTLSGFSYQSLKSKFSEEFNSKINIRNLPWIDKNFFEYNPVLMELKTSIGRKLFIGQNKKKQGKL